MRERAAIAGVLGGLAIVIVLAVVILQFGRYDSPPSLEDNPNPTIPGELVWLDEDRCIVRGLASGESRERVYCIGEYANPVVWVDANHVAFPEHKTGEPAWKVLDLTTKQISATNVSTFEYGGFGPYQSSVKGETVQVDAGGKVYVISGGQRNLVHDFDTGDNWPQFVTWSPDGEWMVFSYGRPRSDGGAELWIMSRDGNVLGTITKKAEPPLASWRIEGVGITPRFDALEKLK